MARMQRKRRRAYSFNGVMFTSNKRWPLHGRRLFAKVHFVADRNLQPDKDGTRTSVMRTRCE